MGWNGMGWSAHGGLRGREHRGSCCRNVFKCGEDLILGRQAEISLIPLAMSWGQGGTVHAETQRNSSGMRGRGLGIASGRPWPISCTEPRSQPLNQTPV